MRRLLSTSFLLAIHLFALAQVNVVMPQNRVVYQRNNQNEASVPVMGLCAPNATRVEARAEAIQAGQGTNTGWLAVDGSPQNGRFGGMVTLRGGWYRLFVRAVAGNTVVGESTIDRVGVGEVFVVAGQSNASGGHLTNPGANDDRVSVVNWFEDDLPEARLPLTFSQAGTNNRMAPFNPLHMWGMLGDRLVNRLNVPVLFLGAAYGGANSEVFKLSALGQNPGGTPGPYLMPYRPIGAALDHYARRTGVRAVLWHQGESDNGWRGTQAYFDNVKTVIDKTRQQSGFGRLPWVVSRVSYIGGRTDPAIIAAQNQLIQSIDQVFPGPETDGYTGPDDRFDGLHFGGNGLNTLTNLWDNWLNNDFFSRSAPGVLSALPPTITTGAIVPIGMNAGQSVSVPYVRENGFASDNVFVVRLLSANGSVVGQLGTGTQNPMSVQLPGDLATGQYSIRVDGTNPAVTGIPSQLFALAGASQVNNSTPNTPNNTPPTNTTTATNTTPGLVRRIGYEYDAPTHGFKLFVDADGPTEVRLQRISGTFAANSWLTANGGAFVDNYNFSNYYPPVALGVGGVEPGQYLMSARRIGQPTTEKSATVFLSHGFRTVFPVPANQAPVVTTFMTSQTASLNTPFALVILSNTFTDPDGELLVYSISGQPDGLTLDRNTITGLPTQTGRFTISVQATDPGGLAVSTEFTLTVLGATTPPPSTTTITPPVSVTTSPPVATTTAPPSTTLPPVNNTGVITGVLRKVGYKYDAPTHGFQLLVEGDGTIEVKIERLDGAFSPSDWGLVVPFTNEPGYTAQRFYPPISLGVGGVVAGRYRLSARIVGKPETLITSDVVLQYGVFPIYVAPPVSTTPPVTTAPPASTTTAPPVGPVYMVTRLGYKYDAPTHGFEVFVEANSAVQVRIERLDGPFGPTDWQLATLYSEQPGYSFRRFYAPLLPGVGGVVAGTYRIVARIANRPETEVSSEVTIQYGMFQTYPPQKSMREVTGEITPLFVFPLVPSDCVGCVRMEGRVLKR
ncbi:MAG: hypothetical protein EAZ91_07175 [Cytophagales bacterium]|nr:MAG: hypothetical protein EAZ91_07175 [Cytophagales bacterium]